MTIDGDKIWDWLLTTVGGGIMAGIFYLIRRVFTNEKQIAVLQENNRIMQEHNKLRDKHREEMHQKLEGRVDEVGRDVKRLLERHTGDHST